MMNKFEKPTDFNKKKLEEFIESAVEEVDKKIKEEGIDANEIAEIAEKLKREGLSAGDKLQEEAFRIYRERLINRELEKRVKD